MAKPTDRISVEPKRSLLSRFVALVLRPGTPDPLRDGSVRRAREDTVAVVNSRGVAFGFLLAVIVPPISSLIVVGPHHKWFTLVMAGIGTAVVGFALAVLVVLVWQFVRAPWRQRDEARDEIDVVRSDLQGRLSEAQDEIEALRNPPVTLTLDKELLPVEVWPPPQSYMDSIRAYFPDAVIVSVTDLWITVRNGSQSLAPGVRAVVASTNPPIGPGQGLGYPPPHDLHWLGGTEKTRDIPGHGFDSVVLATRIKLENGQNLYSSVIPGIFVGPGLAHIDIEVWWDGRKMDSATYPIVRTDMPMELPRPGQPVSAPQPPTAPNQPTPNRAVRRASGKKKRRSGR